MLAQRIVTSIVLLSMILGAIFGLSSSLFSLFILVMMGIACWEWSSLAGLKSLATRALYTTILLAIMVISIYSKMAWNLLLITGIGFWLLALFSICSYPASQLYWSSKPVLLFIGLPLFVPGWFAFFILRGQDDFLFHILFLLALVAAADIGAYFAGRAFGIHKLAAQVSPNKTWEGFVGGLLSCIILVVMAALIYSDYLPEMNLILWLKLLAFSIFISVFSVVGDLFESMVKRLRDVKDSGTILPGHGGVLDRIDGLTAAAPVYAILLLQFGPEFLWLL